MASSSARAALTDLFNHVKPTCEASSACEAHPAPVLRDPAEQPGFDLIGQPQPVAVYKSARQALRSAEGLRAHEGRLFQTTWTTSAPT